MKIDLSFKNLCGIYSIINIVNKKCYVGSSNNVYIRLGKHRSLLKHQKHPNIKLQNSYNKYGKNSFVFKIMEVCEIEKLLEREQYYIDLVCPYYNIILNAEKHIFSDETKLQISKTLKERYQNGYKNSAEKKVDVYDRSGNFIKTFDSITQCCKELEISKDSVTRVMKGINKYCGNYIFYNHGDTNIRTFILKKEIPRLSTQGITSKKPLKITFQGVEYIFNSISEASRQLSINNRTMNRWCKSGQGDKGNMIIEELEYEKYL